MNSAGDDVLIRCDGGATLGLGHVKRCIALAAALQQEGLSCRFAGHYDASAAAAVAAAGLALSSLDGGVEEGRALHALLPKTGGRAILFDIRSNLKADALAGLR